MNPVYVWKNIWLSEQNMTGAAGVACGPGTV